MLAGALRTATAFLPDADPTPLRELLYLTIDLSILFGLQAVYFFQAADLGRTGFAGFVVSVAGTAIIVGPDAVLAGVDVYQAGAASLLAGLTLIAIAAWRRGRLPRYVLASWLLSSVLGVAGSVPGAPAELLPVAGVAFGFGFAGAGAKIWSDPTLPPDQVTG
jgi:hypothetical protein